MKENRILKYSTAILALVFSLTAFAQTNSAENVTSGSLQKPKLGLTVGAEYLNLSTVKTNITKGTGHYYRSGFGNDEGGMHLGMIGIGGAYSLLKEKSIGGLIKFRVLQSFIKSESGENKVTMFIPEGNLGYSFNSLFSIYGGANVSVWTGSEFLKKYTPGLGFQFGVLIQSENFAFSLGSTTMGQTYKDKEDKTSSYYDNSYEVEGTVLVSGVNAGLSYNF